MGRPRHQRAAPVFTPIERVYNNLLAGSYNHLAAFEANLEAL